MAQLIDRMLRAAKLEQGLYEEVEADTGALGQAILVVIIAGVAAGIGTLAMGGIQGLIMGTLSAILSWFVWAYLTYFIGTKLLPESQTSSNPGELLRTIGFSSSPGVIRVFGFVPGVGQILFWAAGIWMLVAMVIGVKAALDYTSTWRAVLVCFIGWVIQIVIFMIIFSLVGGEVAA
ncbi:MAG: YIP1 family protein [Desulfovibrionales bacterium]